MVNMCIKNIVVTCWAPMAYAIQVGVQGKKDDEVFHVGKTFQKVGVLGLMASAALAKPTAATGNGVATTDLDNIAPQVLEFAREMYDWENGHDLTAPDFEAWTLDLLNGNGNVARRMQTGPDDLSSADQDYGAHLGHTGAYPAQFNYQQMADVHAAIRQAFLSLMRAFGGSRRALDEFNFENLDGLTPELRKFAEGLFNWELENGFLTEEGAADFDGWALYLINGDAQEGDNHGRRAQANCGYVHSECDDVQSDWFWSGTCTKKCAQPQPPTPEEQAAIHAAIRQAVCNMFPHLLCGGKRKLAETGSTEVSVDNVNDMDPNFLDFAHALFDFETEQGYIQALNEPSDFENWTVDFVSGNAPAQPQEGDNRRLQVSCGHWHHCDGMGPDDRIPPAPTPLTPEQMADFHAALRRIACQLFGIGNSCGNSRRALSENVNSVADLDDKFVQFAHAMFDFEVEHGFLTESGAADFDWWALDLAGAQPQEGDNRRTQQYDQESQKYVSDALAHIAQDQNNFKPGSAEYQLYQAISESLANEGFM